MKKIAIYLAVFVLAAVGSGMAEAHTTSIGFVSAGTPGSVTFYTGSYHFGGSNEGTLTLEGINGNTYTAPPQSFNIAVTSVKPLGLVDGTNNFYWTNPFGSGTLDKTLTSDPGLGFGGGVNIWQGVTFTGLAAGDYRFSCGATCGTTQVWNSWNFNGSGTLTLTGAVVGAPVPEPGTLVLMGTGLLGLAMWGRKKQQANS